MEDRHDRSALAAGGDIGGAKIIGDVDAEPGRQGRPVADLDRQSLLWAVQHGLAVEPDYRDAGGVDRVVAQEVFDGFGVPIRDHALGEGEHARTRRTILQRRPLGQGAAQQGAVGVGIGIGARRTKRQAGLAVGFDEGYVDSVHGSAGH